MNQHITRTARPASPQAQWLAAIAAGDRTAFGSLYDTHADRLLALARRLLGNRREAEDLLHDVFVDVWHKAASYDPERGSVSSWLSMRIRSRALDRLRSFQVARRHALAEATTAVTSVKRPEQPHRLIEHLHAIRLLSCLSERQLTLIKLSYFGDLSHREIADCCGIPLGTVKSRLAAALVKLRAAARTPRRSTLRATH